MRTAQTRDAGLEAARHIIGGCREELGAPTFDKCWAPAEYVLWGKLLPPEALGPRCYDHAAKHVGHRALSVGANYALIHIGELAAAVEFAALERASQGQEKP